MQKPQTTRKSNKSRERKSAKKKGSDSTMKSMKSQPEKKLDVNDSAENGDQSAFINQDDHEERQAEQLLLNNSPH